MEYKVIVTYPAEHLGFLPDSLDETDPRPAKEQINENYQHGGGWRPVIGCELLPSMDIQYPGDPPCRLLASTQFRNEIIQLYGHSWLLILQEDGTWEISRVD